MVHDTGPGAELSSWLCPAEARGAHTLEVYLLPHVVQSTVNTFTPIFTVFVLFRICLTQSQGLCWVLCSPTGLGTHLKTRALPSLEGRGKGTDAKGALQCPAVLVHVWYVTHQVLSSSKTVVARPFPDVSDEFLCTHSYKFYWNANCSAILWIRVWKMGVQNVVGTFQNLILVFELCCPS